MQLTFFFLPSLAAASILPIKFDFGSSLKSHPSLKSVKQCEGHENDALVRSSIGFLGHFEYLTKISQFLIEGTTPDEICMPGTTAINMHTQIRFITHKFWAHNLSFHFESKFDPLSSREDLPTDLTLNLDLHKVTPFPMTVPCLNGVGSCEYEVTIFFIVSDDISLPIAAVPNDRRHG